MTVTTYRDQAEFDASCTRDGDGGWRDYAPGETPDCDACDAEIDGWPVIAVSLTRVRERVFLCPGHALTLGMGLSGNAERIC